MKTFFVSLLFRNNVYVLLIFLVSVSFVYLILDGLGYIYTVPNENNLLNFDGKWYHSIATEGYQYMEGMCNLAFFPLFPFIWKILQASATVISIVNILVFTGAFLWLFRNRAFSIWSLLFVLCLPSSIFFALPYSEAVFFLSGCMILVGYDRKSMIWLLLGFFLSSMTRSVSIVFIPAIIIIHFLSESKSWIKTMLHIISCIMGTLAASVIQFLDTGRWFYFLEVQQYWGRVWKIPSLPLTTFNAEDILGADSFALIVGLIALYLLAKHTYGYYYLQTYKEEEKPNLATIFSMLYICAIATIDCFFTYEIVNKTNIWSINRHILATPFGFYFLSQTLSKIQQPTDRLVIGSICLLGLFITQLYLYPVQLLFYIMLCAYVFLSELGANMVIYRVFILIILVANLILNFQLFLSHNWVG